MEQSDSYLGLRSLILVNLCKKRLECYDAAPRLIAWGLEHGSVSGASHILLLRGAKRFWVRFSRVVNIRCVWFPSARSTKKVCEVGEYKEFILKGTDREPFTSQLAVDLNAIHHSLRSCSCPSFSTPIAGTVLPSPPLWSLNRGRFSAFLKANVDIPYCAEP